MGIAKKGKPKLVHNDVEYYWWVGDDFEGPTGHEIEVTVSTEDKEFLVKYYINQRDNYFVTVVGKKFGGNVKTGGTWKRFASPKFGELSSFTPKNVVELIDWCLENSDARKLVDYRGNPINA